MFLVHRSHYYTFCQSRRHYSRGILRVSRFVTVAGAHHHGNSLLHRLANQHLLPIMLRPGGAFLYVVPAADHLWELKQVLYDQPYRNREEDVPYEGFSYERVEPVEAVVDVAGEALRDLFQMPPYYWKTPRGGAERLAALDGLRGRASFRVHVFRRR